MSAVLVADFEVDGVPVPQGSKKGFVAGNRAVLVDDNKASLKPWRAAISGAARDAYDGERIEGPVQVVLEFRFVRPKSVKREHPSVKPDIDKLARSVLDGLSDSGIWRDDAQVVRAVLTKTYAERPGVRVQVGEIRNTPNEIKEK